MAQVHFISFLALLWASFQVAAFSPPNCGGLKILRSPSQIFSQQVGAGGLPEPSSPVGPDFYQESWFDKLALAIFRSLVQKKTGFTSKLEGYPGLVEEAQEYMVSQGKSSEDQQKMVYDVLKTAAGPAVGPVYRVFMAPWPWAPFLTALFTPPFFKFLVGPNWLDERKDGAPGGVYVERCRFLEETGCKGLCLNMCKLPTQTFFKEELGLDMTMSPNFETKECRLSFGLKPLPIEEDDEVPRGCLASCISKDALENKENAQRVLCGKAN